MKKNFSVNIQGHLFNIDEDAFKLLERFLKFLKMEFGKEHEVIVNDFKNRISQKLLEFNTEAANTIISIQEIEKVLSEFGYPDSDESQKGSKGKKKLFRNMDSKHLGGVCAGIALRMNMQPKNVRIVFILLAFIFGTGVLMYGVLWLLVPAAYGPIDRLFMIGEPVNVARVKKLYEEQFIQKGITIEKEDAKLFGKNILEFLKLSFFIKVFSGSLFIAISLFLLAGLIALFVMPIEFTYLQGLQTSGLRTSLLVFLGNTWVLFAAKWSFIIFVFVIFSGIFITGFSMSTGIRFNLIRLYKSFRYVGVLCLVVFLVASAWMYLQFLFLEKKETIFFFDKKYSNSIYIELFEKMPVSVSSQSERNSYFCLTENDSLVLGGIPELSLMQTENDSVSIVAHHRAYGGSAIGAAKNIENIHFEIASQNDTLYIMPYWTSFPAVWRAQNVRLTLYLPIGKSIFLSNELMNWFFPSEISYSKPHTGLIMTENGLVEL